MSKIDDNVKQLLRSVLISAPGVKQSFLEKEYFDITGDILPWRKYGFKKIFDFLKALEGEIVRMEFSEMFVDNIIYAVIDESKYVSQHAIKFASRSISTLPGKSPDEIKAWKEEMSKKTSQSQDKNSLPQNNKPFNKQSLKINSVVNKMNSNEKKKSFTEWDHLDQLVPDQSGYYMLRIKNQFSRDLASKSNDLLQLFAAYQPYKSIVYRDRAAVMKFKNFFDAFQAWKMKHCAYLGNELIYVLPFTEKKKSTPYSLLISKLPVGLTVFTLVKAVNEYGSLFSIEPNIKSDCIKVTYSSENGLNEAEKKLKSLPVKNIQFPITVKKCFDSGNPTSPKVVADAFKQPSFSNDVSDDKYIESKNREDLSVKENVKDLSDRVCGFNLDYRAAYEMFKATAHMKPRISLNLSDEIMFTITHPVDACRFWVIDIDKKDALHKLAEIESNLAENISKTKKCTQLPQPGECGFALYYENKSWYRCWIMKTNSDRMDIEVFWCDYGNTGVVSIEDFRTTNNNDIWSLPPLAIPCKFYGYECNLDDEKRHFGAMRVSDLMMGNVFVAKVIKTSTYSQPHIVELDDVKSCGASSVASTEPVVSCLMEEKLIKKVPCKSDSVNNECGIYVNNSEDLQLSKHFTNASMFQYENENLTVGMISEVHHPMFFYIQNGPLEIRTEIETLLQNQILKPARKFTKDSLLIYACNSRRKRVMVLQQVENNEIDILHVDYGIRKQVEASSLFEISQDLRDKPFQARPASLAIPEGLTFHEKATEFLKSLLKTPIRINVINETETGKVDVELFSIDMQKSFTLEMLRTGLICSSVSEKAISGQSLKHTKTAKSSNLSLSGENQDVISVNDSKNNKIEHVTNRIKSSSDGPVKRCTSPTYPPPDTVKSSNLSLSGENQDAISVNGSKNNKSEHVTNRIKSSSDAPVKRCISPTYPPPDILLSNRINFERPEVKIQPNQVILGVGKNRDVIKVNCITKKLDEEDVAAVIVKFKREKTSYLEMLKSLEELVRMPDEYIYETYKEKKKYKLQLMLSIKDLNVHMNIVDSEYKRFTSEINDLLSKV